jgi:hypothetical protein
LETYDSRRGLGYERERKKGFPHRHVQMLPDCPGAEKLPDMSFPGWDDCASWACRACTHGASGRQRTSSFGNNFDLEQSASPDRRTAMKLNILTKFMIGIISLVAIVAGLGLFSLSQLNILNEKVNFIGTSDLPAVKVIGQIEAAMGSYRQLQLQHVIAGNRTAMAD